MHHWWASEPADTLAEPVVDPRTPMRRLVPLLFPVCFFLPMASAAPVPKVVKTPISPANAGRVRQVQELETYVWELSRGPKAGELTFVRWQKPVEVVDEMTFRPLRTVVEGSPIHFAVSATGDRSAWCENSKTVTLKAGDKTTTIDTGNDQPKMTFSPDGKTLVTGGYGDQAKVWDADGQLVRTLDCGGKGGLTPVFSPDGKTLAVGNRNHETRLFEAATGKLLHTLSKKMTQEIAFSPDGKTLATGYVDGAIALWDVATGEQLRSAKSGCTEVYSVDWNPKGDVLMTTGLGGKIVLWEPDTLKPLKELDAPEWVIRGRFSSDGTRLFTSGGSSDGRKEDRKVIAWAVRDGADK
jgi:WD40 repeat protein